MKKVIIGIQKHQVILLKGDSIRDVLAGYVYPKFPHESFSAVNMDLTRVASSLSSKRWDGKRPVIVFFRCEQWMKDLSILIRNRQPKQAVILVTDGEYTSSTQLMKALATVHVVIGKMPATIFSLLKKGPSADAEKRYKGAIECTDTRTVINQIHYSNQDNDVSCTLSDVDVCTVRFFSICRFSKVTRTLILSFTFLTRFLSLSSRGHCDTLGQTLISCAYRRYSIVSCVDIIDVVDIATIGWIVRKNWVFDVVLFSIVRYDVVYSTSFLMGRQFVSNSSGTWYCRTSTSDIVQETSVSWFE